MYVTVPYGGGVHQWDVPLGHVMEFAKVSEQKFFWFKGMSFKGD